MSYKNLYHHDEKNLLLRSNVPQLKHAWSKAFDYVCSMVLTITSQSCSPYKLVQGSHRRATAIIATIIVALYMVIYSTPNGVSSLKTYPITLGVPGEGTNDDGLHAGGVGTH